MNNMQLTSSLMQWLKQHNVTDVCLCPGGRNAPFVEYFTQYPKSFHVHSSFDERSAGFFALGLAQKQQRPVAIITTSGTAVAEVLPSVMEAFYTATPLIVISADRPRRLRGTGAPQAVEQVALFGSYVEACWDFEGEWHPMQWLQALPLHINVCFDEPLLSGNITPLKKVSKPQLPTHQLRFYDSQTWQDTNVPFVQQQLDEFLSNSKNPLLMIGPLTPEERPFVEEFLKRWPGLVYCESTSGLRELPQERLITAGDRLLTWCWKNKKIDAVLRLGGVPTARLWRNLESDVTPVMSISSRPFPGLSRGGMIHTHFENLKELVSQDVAADFADVLAVDRHKSREWKELLERYPQSEPALVYWLSQQIPESDTVYIGNSLPIREWDLVAQREKRLHVLANRGANGIDGQLSTALAWADAQKPLWVVLGDLTTLYDSNALWFWKGQPLKIVVINNRGGQIFSRMFESPLFRNEHHLNFSHWAAQWGLAYKLVQSPQVITSQAELLEIRPDEGQTQSFWSEYDKLWEM